MKKELILIDASWVIHRMWHVHANLSVTLSNGVELRSGHLYGFSRLLKSLNTGHKNADIIVCLDGRATHGKQLNENYKGDRSHGSVKTAFEDLGVLIECAAVFSGTKVAFHRDLEADELISYFSHKHSKDYERIIIYSADGDMIQLLGGNIFISKEFDKGVLKLIDEKVYYTDTRYVDKFCGCKISSLPLYRAMIGDSSDNLPGFPKLRKKLAKLLAERYESIEDLVKGVGEGGVEFPNGFKEFLPTLVTNFKIMRLPTPEELEVRGTLPNIYETEDNEPARSLFSLYRIRSVSPFDTIIVPPSLEDELLSVRDSVNDSWKHPNSV